MKILELDKSYDLHISCYWGNISHGISGHTYEMIEYFLLLTNHFKVGLVLPDINKEILINILTSKYELTNPEINNLFTHTIFIENPLLVKGNNLLLVDGSIQLLKEKTLIFNNILMFACGNKNVEFNESNKVHILQDNRVYNKVHTNGINYVKKILFSKYRKITSDSEDFMIYATKNCRNISNYMYNELNEKYNANFICLTNEENKPQGLPKNFNLVDMPVTNLFERFGTYVYTPVARKFDCSPRFIAECKFYEKEVIYHIDYLSEDRGLYWRKHDIENNFKSLFLTDSDEIINIIKGII